MADSAAGVEAREHGGSHGGLDAAKDLFAGAAGGVAQVLIGQPFDIVKVRLQTTTKYPSAMAAASSILRHEGALAFYKGTLMPLLGIGACVSVQFGAFHAARRWFEQRRHDVSLPSASSSSSSSSSSMTSAPLPLWQYYAAGAFAGVANTALSCPIEHVRIRLQTQPHSAGARLYAGPWDCARKMVARAGVAGGLFRGAAPTLLREANAYGAWFLTFEWLMARETRGTGSGTGTGTGTGETKARDQVPAWKVALYGGLSGEVLWLTSYPLDVVKSKMQADGFGGSNQAPQRYGNMRDCFAQTMRAEGLAGFWKGIGPTLLRAMPVSAGTFAVAEMTMRALR